MTLNKLYVPVLVREGNKKNTYQPFFQSRRFDSLLNNLQDTTVMKKSTFLILQIQKATTYMYTIKFKTTPCV